MKIERVYRELLYQVLEKKVSFLTQRFLSKECFTSLSNVNYALSKLEQMNAIEKKAQGFKVLDAKKILLYWASIRNLRKDIIYKTYIDLPIIEVERAMPNVLFSAYSGYKFLFKQIPAEYGEVFVYGDIKQLGEIKNRFPVKKGEPNLIVLKIDDHLKKFRELPIAQIFVDLWNIDKWYASDFLKILEEKINGILV